MSGMEHIERFLREAFSDQKLIELQQAAERGQLSVMSPYSCLLARSDAGYDAHREIATSRLAENEFIDLAADVRPWWPIGKKVRVAVSQKMLPLINAEIARRADLLTIRHQQESLQLIR